MKLIIAGPRAVLAWSVVDYAMEASKIEPSKLTEIVSGHARGCDRYGEYWANKRKIPIKKFIPDWSAGAKAGPLRNIAMGEYADAAVVVWDGVSTGSKHMYDTMKRLKKPVFLYRIKLEIDDRAVVWHILPDGKRIREGC